MNNYEKLVLLQKQFPELTFQNNGFQYIHPKIREKYKEQIKEISEILKLEIEGFVEFNNFYLKKDGTFDIRCQYRWDRNFTGVGYFNIEWFKEDLNKE